MKAKLTLAAMLPGFLSLSSSAETTLTHIEITEENMGGLVLAPLNVNTPLYIAGHRSHSSHGSHGSPKVLGQQQAPSKMHILRVRQGNGIHMLV